VSDSDGDSYLFTDFINPLVKNGEEQTVVLSEKDDGTPKRVLTLANYTNPVNWTRFIYSMIAGFAAAISIGYQNIVYTAQRLVTAPITGVQSFIVSDLIGEVLEPLADNVRLAWVVPINEAGLFASVVAIGLALASLWILAQLWAWIRDGGVI